MKIEIDLFELEPLKKGREFSPSGKKRGIYKVYNEDSGCWEFYAVVKSYEADPNNYIFMCEADSSIYGLNMIDFFSGKPSVDSKGKEVENIPSQGFSESFILELVKVLTDKK